MAIMIDGEALVKDIRERFEESIKESPYKSLEALAVQEVYYFVYSKVYGGYPCYGAIGEKGEPGVPQHNFKTKDGDVCPFCKGIGNIYPSENSVAICKHCQGTGLVGGKMDLR